MIKNKPVELAVVWMIPALGAAIFVTMQSFTFLNDYVESGGTLQTVTFGDAALLGVSVFYGAWVLPPVLAFSARRGTDWAALVLGGLLVTLSTLAGVTDGLRDGAHLVVLQLMAVTLPGVVALTMSWRHIRAY